MKIMMSERRNQNALANSPTRRQVIAGAAMMFGGLALGLTKLRAATGEEISRTAESIHQETVFKANQKRVYEALTDAKQFNEVKDHCRQGAGHFAREVADSNQSRGGRRVLSFRRHHPRTARRACAGHANRPSLARCLLGSGYLLDCEIRARRARRWDQSRF